MVEQEGAVQPALDVISDRHDPNEMSLARRRLLDGRARKLPTPTIVSVESEIVFQRIRADDVVLSVGKAEDDAARSMSP